MGGAAAAALAALCVRASATRCGPSLCEMTCAATPANLCARPLALARARRRTLADMRPHYERVTGTELELYRYR